MNKRDFEVDLCEELYKKSRIMFLSEKGEVKMKDIYKKLSKTPASRFFVSEERTFRILSQMTRSGNLAVLNHDRKRMYLEIAKRVYDLHQITGYDFKTCLTEVIHSQAPEYYLTPKTIKTKVCRYVRHKRADRQKQR